jgi:Skp family chaperone for outer membrane proteins
MKKMIAVAALIIAAAVPVVAQQTHEEKVACDLAAKNCLNKAEILEKRIKKLNAEIKKGTKTYSAEDLKKLEQKLQETQDLLDQVEGKTPAK